VLETKLRRATVRPEAVARGHLLQRIGQSTAPVTVICAPAGYGKTTLLSQLAAGQSGPVAWVSLDTSDNDPVLLLSEIAMAVERVVPVDPLVFSGLRAPEPSLELETLPKLLNSLARVPIVTLLLDDVDAVRGRHSLELLGVLCEHLPPGARLVLAARERPRLPIARMRARGVLLELGAADLALDPIEAWRLLEAMHLSVEHDTFDLLYARTEGWAAGLYLAATVARESPGTGRALREFGGDDRSVVEYLSSELLTRQPPERIAFLRRTAVLPRFSASLCDAVLERDDSATLIEELARSMGFVMPLDRRGEWYRYHRLFADLLRALLMRSEPRLEPELHERASRWHEHNGTPTEAIDHAFASHNRGRAAALLSRHLRTLFNTGHQTTIQHWLHAFTDADLAANPPLAAAGAWIMGLSGDRAQALHLLWIAERNASNEPFLFGESSAQSAVALLRASLAADGVSQMRTTAELAYRLEPLSSAAHELAALLLGANLFLRGRGGAAQPLLEEAATLGDSDPNSTMCALGLLALIHLDARRLDQAAVRLAEGRELMDRLALDSYSGAVTLFAAGALLELERDDREAAQRELTRAAPLLPRLRAVAWSSILHATLSARAALGLGDLHLAESLLMNARRELSRYPDAGVLPHLLAREERALEATRGGAGVLHEPLTEAELRVLELAPTHLSLEEIGGTLCISRNTVKTHLKAIYGKLHVASRGEAVERAVTIGLISRRSGWS
jgi:LuxR family maltose regulon positive regulatory protein